MNNFKPYKTFFKRFLDILLSLIALIILSPILIFISILVRINLGSPIIFKQPRPGKNEKIFYLYKFRSMMNATDEDGKLLPDNLRLTKFGKFLRKSSIDELPELINILKGDMSIVGPRPLSIYYLPHYPDCFRKRHKVRPGLTGFAQINGRNNLPWNDRFQLDIDYINNLSFILDLKIIANTVSKVFKGSGIVVRGESKVKDYGPYCVLQLENVNQTSKFNKDMTYSEIGSYFWLNNKNPQSISQNNISHFLPKASDSSFTFSGRNAIDLVMRDIVASKKINRVLVPSYSCVSMLQGIIDNNINYSFYKVSFDNNGFSYFIPKVKSGDAVLIMSYFGLNHDKVSNEIIRLKKEGAVVIEDITHSMFSQNGISIDSDYLVTSLRKWFPIPTGGWMGKKEDKFKYKPDLNSDHTVDGKIDGMLEKGEFIKGNITDKENFLLKNSKFDNDLIHVDRLLKIDSTSLAILNSTDIKQVISKRVENAKYLIHKIKELNIEGLQIPDFNFNYSVPLFVPIFLPAALRDSLRQFLINKGIYCPVHWPEIMGAEKGIRENELSLICDQRYSIEDMEAIVSVINIWYKQKNS